MKLIRDFLVSFFSGLVLFILTSYIAHEESINNNISFIDSLIQTLRTPVFIVGLTVVILITIVSIVIHKRTFKYNKATLDHDKAVYKRLINDKIKSSIQYIKKQDFGEVFFYNSLSPVYAIEDWKDDVNFEFINPKLEKAKLEFMNSLSSFKDSIVTKSFIVGNNENNMQVQPNLERDSEKLRQYLNDIHARANILCAKYDKLVHLTRKLI